MLLLKSIVRFLPKNYQLTYNNKLYFFKNNSYQVNYFSTFKSNQNPNEIPEEVKKMMQNQKQKKKKIQLPILKDILQIQNIEKIPQISKKLVFMSKQDRQVAVRYLLSTIYQQRLPFDSVYQKSLLVLLQQFPHLKLQIQIFQINHWIRQINETHKMLDQIELSSDKDQKQKQLLELFNKVNDLYYNAFNSTLKSISKQHDMKIKATLYKHFAEYNFNYLFNPKIVDQNSSMYQSNYSTLKKARQFLTQSLKCHKQIALEEYRKLESQQMSTLKNEDSQIYLIKMNAIKENIRKIVQSMGQCLYAYFKVITKQNKIIKDLNQHKMRKIQLLSLIETFIPMYSIITGIKELSILYHKLYKIKIEAKFTAVGQPKTGEQVKVKIKETVQQYNRLYKQCESCLEQSIKSDNFNNIKQISALMISIKYMMGKNVRKNETQLKNNLALQAKSIIDMMSTEFKQPIQYFLMQIIKQMLQVK